MRTFFYVARDSSGDKVTGTLEAADKQAALATLKQWGRFPISLTEDEAPSLSAVTSEAKTPPLPSLSCPKCSSTDIRRPYGGKAFVIWLIASVLNAILMEVFGENRRSSFVVEILFDTLCFLLLVSLVWLLVDSLSGKNRCKKCGYKWKVEGAPKLSAAPSVVEANNKTIKTSGVAVWSLVLGILSLCCSGFLESKPALILGVFTCIPAIICGHVSRGAVKRSSGTLKGFGMALAGLILAYLAIPCLSFTSFSVFSSALRRKLANKVEVSDAQKAQLDLQSKSQDVLMNLDSTGPLVDKTEEESSARSGSARAALEKMFAKVNSISSGDFQMDYPGTWSLFPIEKSGLVVGFGAKAPKRKPEDVFVSNVTVTWNILSARPITLEQYATFFVNQMTARFPSIKTESRGSVIVAGRQAKRFVLREDGSLPKVVVVCVFLSGETAYHITYMGMAAYYAQDEPIINNMINSFELKPNP